MLVVFALLCFATETLGAGKKKQNLPTWSTTESKFMVDQIKNFTKFRRTVTKWHVEPRQIDEEDTAAGKFFVYRFPLSFSNFTIYRRRFGIDVPKECMHESCPVLFDFHGSYDSLYSQRYWTKWYKYLAQVPADKKFVLVTPEGSPDAVTNPNFKINSNRTGKVGTSTTSWNVLGWGDATVPCPVASSCSDFSNSGCFASAIEDANAYPCFQTRMEMAPRSCKAMPYDSDHGDYELHPGAQMIVRNICASTTAANDWDYLKKVLKFVWKKFDIDRERVYFTGQSMGGMASMQFAVGKGKYWMQDFRPAAIVACSAGGARKNDMELNGEVKTLLMHGYLDAIAPATVWAGYTRDFSQFLQNSTKLTKWLTKDIITAAMHITSNITRPLRLEDQRRMILEANLMSNGRLLENATQELREQWLIGCPGEGDDEPLPISRDGYMWEALRHTLDRVAGRKVDMASELKFRFPAQARVPLNASIANHFKCANVPKTKVDIEVCTFKGGHLWPFQDEVTEDWIPEAGTDGQVFHDFIWMDWLKGGTVRRPPLMDATVYV